MKSDQLEKRIQEFGREIFKAISHSQPSTFNKNYWSGRLMEWSMKRPDFKVNMFRLVDVLPTLKHPESIAGHVREYLSESASAIHPLLGSALRISSSRIGRPFTAFAVKRSVEQMASQFIAGRDAAHALQALRRIRGRGLCFTVDLLGEFSVSERESLIYLNRYREAITTLSKEVGTWKEAASLMPGHPGESSPICVSVKLSALYSQTSPLNFERSVAVLSERLSSLVSQLQAANAMIYVDAEDSNNNPIIYAVFERVFGQIYKDMPYPGIVLQGYAKASGELCERLVGFAKKRGSPIAIRLVKGAYWDSETISCEMNHWPSPLYAKKVSTDAQYEKLTRYLLENREFVLPAFGSHNVRSLAHACCYAESLGAPLTSFELQMLYGMADPIADAFRKQGYLCRLYVPLGEMLPGMGYLVRRLLENTSNESFLRHTFFDQASVDTLLRTPEFDPRDTALEPDLRP